MRRVFAWVAAALCLSCEVVLGIAPLPGEGDAATDAMVDGASDVATNDGGPQDGGDACFTCGSTCVDLSTDPNNCGSCGHTCGDAGYGCVNGGCGNEVVDLATGGFHACAVLRAGEVWCWGLNDDQECGGPGGSLTCYYGTHCRVPTKVAGISKAIAIAGASASTCAVDQNGAVFCWGINTNQELGNDGGTAGSPIPVSLPDKVTQIAGGYAMMCAVTINHDLYCWGLNQCGSLGLGFEGASDGGYAGNFAPVLVKSDVTSVRLSYPDQPGSTCVTPTDGGAICWGSNVYNALGPTTSLCGGPAGSAYNPLPTPYSVTGVTRIWPGLTTCAVAAGTVYCSGVNGTNGSIGNGDSLGSSSPVIASSLPGNKTFVDVSSSGTYACALASTGEVYCWGSPAGGAIGAGFDDAGLPVQKLCQGVPCWPSATRVGTINATILRTGGDVSYAVDDGGVWAWGWNDDGQLGHQAGTLGDRQDATGRWFNAIPTRVPLP